MVWPEHTDTMILIMNSTFIFKRGGVPRQEDDDKCKKGCKTVQLDGLTSSVQKPDGVLKPYDWVPKITATSQLHSDNDACELTSAYVCTAC